jgi:hypothetical protein
MQNGPCGTPQAHRSMRGFQHLLHGRLLELLGASTQLAICSKSPCSIAVSSWPYLQDAIYSSPPLQLSRKVVRTRSEHSSQSARTLHYVKNSSRDDRWAKPLKWSWKSSYDFTSLNFGKLVDFLMLRTMVNLLYNRRRCERSDQKTSWRHCSSVDVAPRNRLCTFFDRIYPKENIVYTGILPIFHTKNRSRYRGLYVWCLMIWV